MRGTTEKQVQHGIVKLLRTLSFSVWDMSQPRRTMQTPGFPDLVAMGRGRILFIEVKTKRGRLSDAQKVFRDECTQNGGEYLVWRSASEAWDWLVERHVVEEAA